MFVRYLAILFSVWTIVVLASANSSIRYAAAQSSDPHQIYETKCAGCHQAHAGEFVRAHLEQYADGLVGRETGVDLQTFLTRGHGKLTMEEIDVLIMHLNSILDSGALFQDKCLICHDRAVVFARGRLILKGDKLLGRYTGRDIETFLRDHGRLEPKEVTTMVSVLKRQLIARPAPE